MQRTSRSLRQDMTSSASAGRSGSGCRSLVARTDLYERLSGAAAGGVTLVSAGAGSGKTVLLRSWIEDAGLGGRTAYLTVDRGERDPERFWLRVVETLAATEAGGDLGAKLTAASDLRGEAAVRRIISELARLEDPFLLVIDDLHELRSPPALAQLGALLDRRPPLLGVVLATRHDPLPELGLHRLRLSGELTELRGSDLRFTLDETAKLLAASGIELSEGVVERLHERTEGWAAGLRLAVLSLAGDLDAEQFVAEFSGSDRTVADYLLAEVLGRQPEEVRRLLLRTSILERVNGALADVLLETSGSERILLQLEQENAFVTSLDADRTWFHYGRLFSDLLRLELRRSEPGAISALHRAAAAWLEEQGQVVEAVRHAQAAGDWSHAARLVADHSLSLSLDGLDATIHSLLAAFPEDTLSDPELARVCASDELVRGSLDTAETYLALAERRAREVSHERRRRFEVALKVARLSLARRRRDVGSVLELAGALLTPALVETPGEVVLGNEARAVALMDLGIVELSSFRPDDGREHLGQALALARGMELPYVQVGCLGYLAIADCLRSPGRVRGRCLEAVAIAETHGWEAEPIACMALAALGVAAVVQGRFQEAQHWLDRATQALQPELEPAEALLTASARGMLYLGQGRPRDALVELHVAEQCQAKLATPHAVMFLVRQFHVCAQLCLKEYTAARAIVDGLSDDEREWAEARFASAALHQAEGDWQAAADDLAPVLAGRVAVIFDSSVVQALLLDALARHRLGELKTAEADVERALDLAEPDGLVFPFLITPVRELLERHPRHRTAHAGLLSDILDVLGGSERPSSSCERFVVHEDLSESELRILRHLPSNLSAPEIASELYLSTSTVKTHMAHIYSKLDAHRRSDAVKHARELGLLTPLSARGVAAAG